MRWMQLESRPGKRVYTTWALEILKVEGQGQRVLPVRAVTGESGMGSWALEPDVGRKGTSRLTRV